MSLEDIKAHIEAAEGKAGRALGSVQLIAVSKVQPNERVEAVLQEGHRCFGENRVQEAAGKWPDFSKQFSGLDLHLIASAVQIALSILQMLLPHETVLVGIGAQKGIQPLFQVPFKLIQPCRRHQWCLPALEWPRMPGKGRLLLTFMVLIRA